MTEPALTLTRYTTAVSAWLDGTQRATVKGILDGMTPADLQALFQVIKLVEEAGEVAQAVVGMYAVNPRKGPTATREDVLDELCDVIVTAEVAMNTLAGSPDAAQAHLDDYLARRHARLRAANEGGSA